MSGAYSAWRFAPYKFVTINTIDAMKTFTDSNGNKYAATDKRLIDAYRRVADDWREIERAIRLEDPYASHISEADKDQFLADGLKEADKIESMECNSFTIWQRVNLVLTGNCVALLP